MRFYNYYKERPGVKHGDVYFRCALLGAFIAFFFIGGFKLIIYLIKLAIEYWVWVIGLMACAFLARHFLLKKKMRKVQEMRIVE